MKLQIIMNLPMQLTKRDPRNATKLRQGPIDWVPCNWPTVQLEECGTSRMRE